MQKVVYGLLGLAAGTATMEAVMQLIEWTPLWRVLPVSEISAYSIPLQDTAIGPTPKATGSRRTEAPIRISNLGLRDRERPYVPGTAPRTVVVGDSIIEALQVEQSQTAVAIAEANISSRIAGAEVINLGLAGSTPPVEVARLQTVGSDLKPNLAIVFVSMGRSRAPARSSSIPW
jgi:hypothetical protein